MNEEVQEGKVSAVTKAMEDMVKDINALDDKVNALGSRLSQVLSPELTITEGACTTAHMPMPAAPAMSPVLQHILDASHLVGVIGRHVQHLTERLEV
jgi:hypothetical protein